MKITKYIHACILLTEGEDSILFDPGMFTFMNNAVTPEQFSNVKLIVYTHDHPDHIDMEALTKIEALSHAPVLTTLEIGKKLLDEGFKGKVVTDMEYSIGAFTLKAIPADHEAILSPRLPQNYGYLVNNRILHPGDSYAESLTDTGADVLLFPIMAPWATELAAFAFAKKVAPKIAIPIHDGFAKDFFLDSRYKNFTTNLAPLGIEFKALRNAGDSVEV